MDGNPVGMALCGGSGSTGSSLLQAILNRHPAILAGQETCLFIYPHLFKKWRRYRRYLIKKGVLGVKSTGWSLRNGADLLHEDYGWEPSELEHAILNSISFQDFVHCFFQKPLENKGAKFWIEKTPQNACSFHTYLEYFPNGKIIHTTRNPYDTVASLMARGHNAYEAAGYYVYHVAAAISLCDHSRYHEVRYSDLVAEPEKVLKALFAFLGLPFDAKILQPSDQELNNPLKIKGWQHSERGHIEKSSVGRFTKLPGEQQDEIVAALQLFRISEKHVRQNDFKFVDCKSLCKELGFEFKETEADNYLSKFSQFCCQDMWWRTRRLHPTHFLNYPGSLKNLDAKR